MLLSAPEQGRDFLRIERGRIFMPAQRAAGRHQVEQRGIDQALLVIIDGRGWLLIGRPIRDEVQIIGKLLLPFRGCALGFRQ